VSFLLLGSDIVDEETYITYFPSVQWNSVLPNPPPNSRFFIGINWFGDIPDHQQASDVRRQGATTEAYGPIRRKEERTQATQQMMS